MGMTPEEQTLLHVLAVQYPTIDAAVAESSALRASLSLPKGVVHIVSDVHGDYRKLRHIISNASGSLRPLVTELFKDRLNEQKLWEFLAVLYYPYEAMDYLGIRTADENRQKEWVRNTLLQQFEIVRALAETYRRSSITRLFPAEYRELFEELLSSQNAGRDTQYVSTMIDALTSYGRGLEVVRAASRLVRNLTVAELIVAGDLGDRGPRIDRVIDYLMVQPRVSFTWGNHDASWMGACLGHEALICTVLRLSLRYRRLSQLEEGYGITMAPLEHLARTVYGSDPAERFRTKGSGLRDDLQMARMQKAIAIMQFKLEAQVIKR
ncbi:MAG TPA: fructose-bisphosphatase class III, partial [Bacteroidota bacterium]